MFLNLCGRRSKEDIYTSKVKYILRRGKPYIWVPEKESHNVVGIVYLYCWKGYDQIYFLGWKTIQVDFGLILITWNETLSVSCFSGCP